jgi:hypothetical protein
VRRASLTVPGGRRQYTWCAEHARSTFELLKAMQAKNLSSELSSAKGKNRSAIVPRKREGRAQVSDHAVDSRKGASGYLLKAVDVAVYSYRPSSQDAAR